MFSPIVTERVGWYVYALRDPRDGRVFYIGKGVGNRVFQHALAELAAEDEDGLSTKLETIRGIRRAGREVDAYILRHGIATEQAAYDVEAALIDLLRLLDPGMDNALFRVTNAVLGWDHATKGLAHVQVITSLYDAPKAPEITEAVVMLRIPRLWTPQMPPEALYEATHGWWRIGVRREKARYAFSVNGGVVRAIYRIDSWRTRQGGDRGWSEDEPDRPRWGFEGAPAPELYDRYLNASVAHLFKKGDAGVVKYVNC